MKKAKATPKTGTKKGKTKKKEPRAQTQAFYIENIVFEQIMIEAKEQDRSNSNAVNKILKDYFRKKGTIKD